MDTTGIRAAQPIATSERKAGELKARDCTTAVRAARHNAAMAFDYVSAQRRQISLTEIL
jgi:hypothetical protein